MNYFNNDLIKKIIENHGVQYYFKTRVKIPDISDPK